MLLKKRIDFFVSPWSVVSYESKKIGKSDEIRTIGKRLEQQFVYMAFSKANPKNFKRMQDYNKGLFLLLKTGEYSEIMKAHGFK